MRNVPLIPLKCQAAKRLSDIERDRQPVLITSHDPHGTGQGDPEYGSGMQQHMPLLEGIARGERAVAAGRVVSQAQAGKRLARWLK